VWRTSSADRRPGSGGASGKEHPVVSDVVSLVRVVEEIHRRAAILAARVAAELAEMDEIPDEDGGAPRVEAAGRGGGVDGPPWRSLAEDVLPLSAKLGWADQATRRRAALERQQARLLREGHALGDQARALKQAGLDMRDRRPDGPVAAWWRDVLTWAGEVRAHQRRTAAWREQLAAYGRRRRERWQGP
jgi:hypothetical protein